MQSVTAIICRERDATVDDNGKKKKVKGGGEEKKKRLYEGGKAGKRNGLNSGRPFIASASWILCEGPRFFPLFFSPRYAPWLKRDTRATFRCTTTWRDYVWMRGIFMRANRRETRITSGENFRDAITWVTLPRVDVLFFSPSSVYK